ncbi:type II secretion system protein GspK [Pseudomonas sp. LB3P31]
MSQRPGGFALISVLLVMSLALLITSALLRSHQLMLQSSGQQVQQIDLHQLALGAQTRALLVLQDAVQASSKTVDRTQEWALLPADFDSEDAQIRVEITDLGGRFNLNALLVAGQIDQVTLNRWERLQDLLDLPHLQLSQVGALRELSQLRLLPGVDDQRLRLLEPWVALLPKEAALNINTAPALLLSMLGDLSPATADSLIAQASSAAWGSVQAFTQDSLISGLGLSSHGLGVTSRWFRITVEVTRAGRVLRMATDVERDARTDQWKVLQRRFLSVLAHEVAR